MCFVLLINLCFGFVVNIDGIVFDYQDFYSKYTKLEWEGASDKNKGSILKDYIKRESCALEAKKLGFDKDPFVLQKINTVKKQLLVNFAYEEFVARPLIGETLFKLGELNLKEEVFIKHLLISFNTSSLSSPPSRTKEEALFLATSIVDSLKKDIDSFSFFVQKHSDDPSSKNNDGVLGWLQWGRAPLSFQEAAWNLSLKKVSLPILTDYGYHIIIVEEIRPSEFSFYDHSSYNQAVLSSSLSSVNKQLKSAAIAYDKEQLRFAGVSFYEEEINSFLEHYSSFKSDMKLEGKKHFDFSLFVKNINTRFLICSFLEEDYGLAWFAEKAKGLPPSKIPTLNSYEDVVSFFEPFVLRELSLRKSLNSKIDLEVFFKKRLSLEKNKILYDSYLKFLVNNVSIDSSSVKQYFLMNRDKKYINPEQVVVRQIRLENALLADSLLTLIEKDPSLFNSLARDFSINRRESFGLMEPFSPGKYNELGEAAFKLTVGEVSGVIKNLDKTYSIIKLENKIEKKYLEFNKVYKRIESLLLKEGQEDIKASTFNKYINNKGVVFSEEFKPFFN